MNEEQVIMGVRHVVQWCDLHSLPLVLAIIAAIMLILKK